jgi:ferritin-like metal-binding protein YciE
MAKILPKTRNAHQQARVEKSSQLLKRYYVAERQLMRTLAAWFVDTSQWDIKRLLARHMWQTSRHADILRSRVLELRYPRRDVDKKYNPNLLAFMAEVAKAKSPQEFVAGIYGVVLPELLRSYNAYLSYTDDLDDAPTVYLLQHIIADKQAQVEQMQALLAGVMPRTFEDAHDWQEYLRLYLASIGGFSGTDAAGTAPTGHSCAGRPTYDVGREVKRDARWRPALYHLPHQNKFDLAGRKAWQRIEQLDKRVAMQVWSAISHFNEIWAGEVVATSLWDLDNQPWEFYLDLARWCWDEVRHSMMGYRALEGWGWDVPDLVPWGDANYNALGPMTPIQRLALLFYYEEGLMRAGTKQVELKILESAQDEGSVQDMDFDWADEAIHVSYGFRWLRHLLGDDNAGQAELKRLTDDARDIMAKYVEAHKDDPEATLAPYFERLLPVITEMLRDIPDDGLDVKWQPVAADEAVLEDYR